MRRTLELDTGFRLGYYSVVTHEFRPCLSLQRFCYTNNPKQVVTDTLGHHLNRQKRTVE